MMVLIYIECLFFSVFFAPSFSFSYFINLIPNGDSEHSALKCQALGHEGCMPGAKINSFGSDFQNSGYKWTKTFCEMDSDGDGLTNGQELGDVCCKWDFENPDENALRTNNLSHPADKNSVNNKTKICENRTEGKDSNVYENGVPSISAISLESEDIKPIESLYPSDIYSNNITPKVFISPSLLPLSSSKSSPSLENYNEIKSSPLVSVDPFEPYYKDRRKENREPYIYEEYEEVFNESPEPERLSSGIVGNRESMGVNGSDSNYSSDNLTKDAKSAPNEHNYMPDYNMGLIVENAKLFLVDGKQIFINELQVGDIVLVGPGTYSSVSLLSNPIEALGLYPGMNMSLKDSISFTLSSGFKFELAAAAFVHMKNNSGGTVVNQLNRADSIQIGQYIPLVRNDSFREIDEEIVSIENTNLQVFYYLKTVQGDIVVDNIKMVTNGKGISCFE